MNEMNENSSVSETGIKTVVSVISRTSFITLIITSAVFSAFALLSTIFYTCAKQKYNVLNSLYVLIGESSIPFVNLICGMILFALLVLLTVSLLTAYLGASKNNISKLLKGLNMTLNSLVGLIIFASCLLIIAFASVSATYFDFNLNFHSNYYDYTGMYDATSLFFLCILFGAGAITLIISLIRFVLSLRNAANGNGLVKGGVTLTIISSIYCASITAISFIINLGKLVIPYNYMTSSKTLDPSLLIGILFSVILSAALTIMLVAIAVITVSYSSSVNKSMYPNNNYINNYATNFSNQRLNRTPYVNPVQPSMPVPPAKPYTAQTHQQYQQFAANSYSQVVPTQNQSLNENSQKAAYIPQQETHQTAQAPIDNQNQPANENFQNAADTSKSDNDIFSQSNMSDAAEKSKSVNLEK